MELGLPVILAILLGIFLKSRPDISNKLIPILIFGSQFIGRLLLELGVSTANAGVLSGFAKLAGPALEQMFWQSAMATVLAVGGHSAVKNTKQGGSLFLKFFRGFAAAKATEVALSAAEKAAKQAEKDLKDLPQAPPQP